MSPIRRNLVLAFAVISLCTGCSSSLTRVKPYERGHFADEKMQYDILPQRGEHEGHVFLIREASAGGESAFQGGCGCR